MHGYGALCPVYSLSTSIIETRDPVRVIVLCQISFRSFGPSDGRCGAHAHAWDLAMKVHVF